MISTMFWLSWPLRTDGQVQLVFDSASWIETINIVSQTVELVQSAAAQLKSLGDLAAIQQVARDTEALIRDLQGIAAEITGQANAWRQLTGSTAIPTTAMGLAQWNGQAAVLTQSCVHTAMKAQGLLTATVNSLNLLLRLISLIGGLAGSKAGLQELSALMAKVEGSLARSQAMVASFQQTMMGGELIKSVNAQARYRIGQARLTCFGSIKPCP